MSIATEVFRGYVGGGLDARVRRGFAAYTGLPQPPVGQYQDCTSISPPGDSLITGSVPPVVVGDIFITPFVTVPSGYVIVLNGDGTLDILCAGDKSRQSFTFQIFRVASNTIDGPGTVWVNEVAPLWAASVTIPATLIGVPIGSINLANALYASSPEGDVLTFSLASGVLPAGLSLSSAGDISGTPTSQGASTFTVSATDSTGTSTASASNLIVVVGRAVPAIVGLSTAAANAAVIGVGLVPIDGTTYSAIPAGFVATQSPVAGSIATLGSTVSVGVSIGPAPYQVINPQVVNLINKPVTTRQFSWKEMVIRQWGSEYSAPDHRIYMFSNNRAFDSTDLYQTGIYRPPGALGAVTVPPEFYLLSDDGNILETEGGTGLVLE